MPISVRRRGLYSTRKERRWTSRAWCGIRCDGLNIIAILVSGDPPTCEGLSADQSSSRHTHWRRRLSICTRAAESPEGRQQRSPPPPGRLYQYRPSTAGRCPCSCTLHDARLYCRASGSGRGGAHRSCVNDLVLRATVRAWHVPVDMGPRVKLAGWLEQERRVPRRRIGTRVTSLERAPPRDKEKCMAPSGTIDYA